jgi:hypothetical protein
MKIVGLGPTDHETYVFGLKEIVAIAFGSV